MFIAALPRLTTLAFLAFLPLSILWKGGKTLETTWILVVVAWVCTLSFWQSQRAGSEEGERTPLSLWVPLALFLLWTFISYLTSQTGNYGLDEVLRDSSLVLLFLWVLRESPRLTYSLPLSTRLLQILTVSTVVAAFLGVIVYIFQPVPRFVGSFFDWRFHTDYWPNAWVELVLMVWPLVWLTMTRGVPRLFLTGFLLATLFLSYSRAAYIAFCLQCILWGFFHWSRGGRPPLRAFVRHLLPSTLTILSITIGGILCITALRAEFSPVLSIGEKLTFTAAEGTSSITERTQFWQQAWQLLWEKPLFGHGPYSFRFVQTRLQEGVFATSDHAHNLFLKYAAERGLPAAILFGVFLITILWPALSTLTRISSANKTSVILEQPTNPFDQLRAGQPTNNISPLLPLTIAITGVLFHLLLDFNLQFVGIALPFWILLALLAKELPPSSLSPSPRLLRFAEISLVTALMLLALFEGRFLLLSSLGRHAEARSDLQTALTWYERARGETFSRDLHLSRAHLFLLQEKPTDALHALDDYLQVNRHDARAWVLLGDTHQKLNDLPAARTAYEEAVRLGKWNHLGALRGLLTVLRAQKEKDAITARRDEFDALLAAYLRAIERNTHFIALTPNVEEFLTITNTLATLFPDDAPRYQAMGAKVDREAQEERARIAARPVGRLW